MPQLWVLGEREPILDVQRGKRLREIAQHAVEAPPGTQVVESDEQIARERLGLRATAPGLDQARAELVERNESLLWKCDRHAATYHDHGSGVTSSRAPRAAQDVPSARFATPRALWLRNASEAS